MIRRRTVIFLVLGLASIFVLGNPDGTGTKTFAFPSSVNHISFVIVDSGKEILEIQTDPGKIISGIAKKQE